MARLRIHADARSARLTGWLKNSQIIFGEDQVLVVPTMVAQASSCQN